MILACKYLKCCNFSFSYVWVRERVRDISCSSLFCCWGFVGSTGAGFQHTLIFKSSTFFQDDAKRSASATHSFKNKHNISKVNKIAVCLLIEIAGVQCDLSMQSQTLPFSFPCSSPASSGYYQKLLHGKHNSDRVWLRHSIGH